MRNPPDFVMYVVMVKLPSNKNFDPVWILNEPEGRYFAQGFKKRREAIEDLRIYQRAYGKKNAYVQQYGPFR
jgi:hypothetical protein